MPPHEFEDRKKVRESGARPHSPVMDCHDEPENHAPATGRAVSTFDVNHGIISASRDEDDPVEIKIDAAESMVERDALTSEVVDLVISITKKTIGKLIEKTFEVDSELVSTGIKLAALYRSLSDIYDSEGEDYSARLDAMVKLIDEQSEILPDNITELKSWVELASDALLLKGINLGRPMSENLQDLVRRTRKLLENRTLRRFLPEERLEQFKWLLEQCSLSLGLLTGIRNLPDDAAFSDYLRLLKSDLLFRNIAPASLIELVDFTNKVKAKLDELDDDVLQSVAAFPIQGGYDEKLAWLLEILSAPHIHRALAPYFDSRLMMLLRTPSALIHLFQTWPAEATTLGKLHWIVTQAHVSDENNLFNGTLLEPLLLNLNQSLAGGEEIMLAIEMIMKLIDPKVSRFERLKILLQPIVTTENFLVVYTARSDVPGRLDFAAHRFRCAAR